MDESITDDFVYFERGCPKQGVESLGPGTSSAVKSCCNLRISTQQLPGPLLIHRQRRRGSTTSSCTVTLNLSKMTIKG